MAIFFDPELEKKQASSPSREISVPVEDDLVRHIHGYHVRQLGSERFALVTGELDRASQVGVLDCFRLTAQPLLREPEQVVRKLVTYHHGQHHIRDTLLPVALQYIHVNIPIWNKASESNRVTHCTFNTLMSHDVFNFFASVPSRSVAVRVMRAVERKVGSRTAAGERVADRAASSPTVATVVAPALKDVVCVVGYPAPPVLWRGVELNRRHERFAEHVLVPVRPEGVVLRGIKHPTRRGGARGVVVGGHHRETVWVVVALLQTVLDGRVPAVQCFPFSLGQLGLPVVSTLPIFVCPSKHNLN
jgi:hypothetical protein